MEFIIIISKKEEFNLEHNNSEDHIGFEIQNIEIKFLILNNKLF